MPINGPKLGKESFSFRQKQNAALKRKRSSLDIPTYFIHQVSELKNHQVKQVNIIIRLLNTLSGVGVVSQMLWNASSGLEIHIISWKAIFQNASET